MTLNILTLKHDFVERMRSGEINHKRLNRLMSLVGSRENHAPGVCLHPVDADCYENNLGDKVSSGHPVLSLC